MRLLTIIFIATFSLSSFAEESDIWSESYKLEASGKYQEAADLIIKNISKTKDKEFANMRYAWLSYLLGNYDNSIKYYQNALAMNPNSIDAKLGITLPYLAKQEYSKVKRYAKQVIDISPWNYTAHIRLMICEQSRKQWATLKNHAKQLSEHYPTDTTILVYLARAQTNLGDVSNAKNTYNKVLIRYPGHIEATNYITK